jgi:hypothetical protein
VALNADQECTDDAASNTYIEYSCNSEYDSGMDDDDDFDTLVYDSAQAQTIISQAEADGCVTMNSVYGCAESGKGNSSCACLSKPNVYLWWIIYIYIYLWWIHHGLTLVVNRFWCRFARL